MGPIHAVIAAKAQFGKRNKSSINMDKKLLETILERTLHEFIEEGRLELVDQDGEDTYRVTDKGMDWIQEETNCRTCRVEDHGTCGFDEPDTDECDCCNNTRNADAIIKRGYF